MTNDTTHHPFPEENRDTHFSGNTTAQTTAAQSTPASPPPAPMWQGTAAGAQPQAQAFAFSPDPRAANASQKKKKADIITWIAIALAVFFAATTILGAFARNNVKLSGSTLTGTVTAVEGNRITISLGTDKGSFSLGSMNGQMPQGTAPDRQSADNENVAQSEQSATQGDVQQDDSDSLPQRPDNPPDRQDEFEKSAPSDAGTADAITVKLGIGTSVTNGTEKSSVGEICVGDSVTLTFGAFNTVKTVAVSTAQSNGFFFNQD